MSVPASRVVARRQWQLLFRRHASTTATAEATASAAKEKASTAAAKAQEGLSRVTSSASGAINKAGSAMGSVGGRTGRVIGFVGSLVPQAVYYGKVGFELAKLVARDQKMAFPTSEAFTQTYRSAWQSIQSGGVSKYLNSVRNMGTAEMVGVGILGAELLGFFTVGEIIGRFKIVGYRGGKHDHEH